MGTLSRTDITLRVIALPDGIEIDDSLFSALNQGDIDFAVLRDGDVFDRWRQFGEGCKQDSVVAWRTSTSKCFLLHHAPDSPVMRARWRARVTELGNNIKALDPSVAEAVASVKFENDLLEPVNSTASTHQSQVRGWWLVAGGWWSLMFKPLRCRGSWRPFVNV